VYSHRHITEQTHQWDVPFGVPTSEGPLHLVVPFIFRYFFFMQRNHINVLIFPINTFLEHAVYLLETPQHQF